MGSLPERCDAGRRRRRTLVDAGLALALTTAIACQVENATPWQGARAKSGHVGVALVLGAQGTVDHVTYRISHANGFERGGEIPVYDESGEYSAWFGLPAADAYQIWLQATTSTGESCEGTASFDVREGQRVSAQVLMHCGGELAPGTGELHVTGTLNSCPVLESVVASAGGARVGGNVELVATATDTDAVPGPMQHTWTSSGGTWSDAYGASTMFTCVSEGDVVVTLAVSDGDPACQTGLMFTLQCLPPPSEAEPVVVLPEVEPDLPPVPVAPDAGIGE